MSGRLLDLQLSVLGSKAPWTALQKQAQNPWDRTILAIHAAEAGQVSTAAGWLQDSPPALTQAWKRAYLAGPQPEPGTWTLVDRGLGQTHAASLLQARLMEAGGQDAVSFRRAASDRLRMRLWALGALGCLAGMVLVGGLGFALFLSIRKPTPPAPLPPLAPRRTSPGHPLPGLVPGHAVFGHLRPGPPGGPAFPASLGPALRLSLPRPHRHRPPLRNGGNRFQGALAPHDSWAPGPEPGLGPGLPGPHRAPGPCPLPCPEPSDAERGASTAGTDRNPHQGPHPWDRPPPLPDGGVAGPLLRGTHVPGLPPPGPPTSPLPLARSAPGGPGLRRHAPPTHGPAPS